MGMMGQNYDCAVELRCCMATESTRDERESVQVTRPLQILKDEQEDVCVEVLEAEGVFRRGPGEQRGDKTAETAETTLRCASSQGHRAAERSDDYVRVPSS